MKSLPNEQVGTTVPAALPGFEHINRYWDPQHGVCAAKILPGEHYVTRHDEMIVTVLGSCVSACVRDTALGIGGMNHFMLPVDNGTASDSWSGADTAMRYGSYAMERLINDILKLGGARRHLEVKVVGGGRILAQMTDVGRSNIEFVRQYLRTEGLKVAGEDLGDIYPRKVHYLPASGKVQVKQLKSLHNNTLIERETAYMQELKRRPIEGEITLF